jgi:hypothetical protein
MPTVDVAPLVTPTYTPTLLVPTDGTTLTQALLTNLIVGLANRTEFLRDLQLEASDTPEAYCTLREDFHGAIFTSGSSRIDAEFPWRTSVLGLPAVNQRAGTGKNPGLLELSLPPTGSGGEPDHGIDFYLSTSSSGGPFTFATVEALTVVVKIDEDAANANFTTQFGFASQTGMAQQPGGTDSIQICRNVAVSPTKWWLFRRKASSNTITVLTAADFANSEYHVWRIAKQASGDWALSLNGVLVHTIAAADLPVGACNLRFWQLNGVADTEISKVSWDLISLRTKPNDRSGA